MNVDDARLIWGDDLTHDELVEWVRDVNSRAKTCTADDPSVPPGSTINISGVGTDTP
jgi:hypothetical protein